MQTERLFTRGAFRPLFYWPYADGFFSILLSLKNKLFSHKLSIYAALGHGRQIWLGGVHFESFFCTSGTGFFLFIVAFKATLRRSLNVCTAVRPKVIDFLDV